MEEWKRNSWQFQQELFRQLGNRKWDDLGGDKDILVKKVEFAFEICYGEEYTKNCSTKKVTDKVKSELLKFFEEKNYNENFSHTFLNMKMKNNGSEGIYCVFWLQTAEGAEICVDLSGRNYKTWEDFLKNNVLPKCFIVYPKYGRYYDETNFKEDCVDVLFEESKACGVSRILKTVADIVTTVGGIAATGVLVLNPVGASVLIGATVVSIATGIYGAGNSVVKLVDIHKHDGGLSATNSKTLLAVGELIISAAGTAAVGASAGVKGFAAATGTVLPRGSILCKLAQNLSKITRVFSGINAGFNIIIIVDKYNREGKLERKDILHLAKVLFFSFNVFASEELLSSFISFMAESFPLDRVIQYCVESPTRAYSVCSRIYRFCSNSDIPKLIEIIFPNFDIFMEKHSDTINLIRRTAAIADQTLLAVKKKKFDNEFFYFLHKELSILWTEVTDYKKKNELEIKEKFGQDTWNIIDKWTVNDGIDLHGKDSKFERKIVTPIEMKKKVSETISFCCKHIESEIWLEALENHLFSELLKLVYLHGWENRSPTYIDSKLNFYCNTLQNLYRKITDFYHYEYFTYTINHNKNISKHDFFRLQYQISNIHECVYDLSFDSLKENIHDFHEQFEKDIVDLPNSVDQQKQRVIFEFQMPCYTSKLLKEDFYKKAKELIPRLEKKLNDNFTSFNNYHGLAIIKSNQDDFALFYYTVIEDNFVKGILLLVEDICD